MTQHPTLQQYLREWAGSDEMNLAVKQTIELITKAGREIAYLLAWGTLDGKPIPEPAQSTKGTEPEQFDFLANEILVEQLRCAPVAYLASEGLDKPMAISEGAALYVAAHPLDGSSLLDTNVPVGTLFSIMPMARSENAGDTDCFLQPGTQQLAAGYIIYGPRTALVLTLGQGTHKFTLNPASGEFCLTRESIQIAPETNEFAINSSNFRRWDGHIKAYIDDCLKGEDGPVGKNYNMRWIASLVAECHRIMSRGGIFLYPGDRRPEYQSGRLRLIYEGNPIAFLMEQAGGAASTGYVRIMELVPSDIHQRVPVIFGSVEEVRLVEHYYRECDPYQGRSALFGERGLFRA
jgi:fructose-1,6-bisphosphatase I